MINYLIEYREYDKDDSGFDITDQNFTANCAGYYINDECGTKRELVIVKPVGRNDYLFCYILKGSMFFEIDGHRLLAKNGFVLIPPHIPYSSRNAPIDGEYEIYWVHFSGNQVKEYLNECELTGDYFYQTNRIDEVITSVQMMARELTFRLPGYEHVVQSLLMYILVISSRYYTSAIHTSKNIDLRMHKVMEHIYHNYNNYLTVKDLAELIDLSVSHFSNLFKQTFGLYPLQYIINFRLKRACDLLKHTQYSVSRVAEMTGFNDPLYFSRVFRKQMNVSPSDYRKKINIEPFEDSLIKYL